MKDNKRKLLRTAVGIMAVVGFALMLLSAGTSDYNATVSGSAPANLWALDVAGLLLMAPAGVVSVLRYKRGL